MIRMLRELTASPDFEKEEPDTQDRIQETLRLMDAMGSWADEMLRLTPNTLEKVLKLGSKIQKLIH